jgi:hypothetical protein
VDTSRHRAAWHDPLHWLSGYLGNEVVVAVVVQERDLFPFSDSCDQQVGEAHSPDPPAVPQHGLHVKRPMPVLIMGRQPLVALLAVGPDQIKLSGTPSRPAELKFDHTARRDEPRLDKRT